MKHLHQISNHDRVRQACCSYVFNFRSVVGHCQILCVFLSCSNDDRKLSIVLHNKNKASTAMLHAILSCMRTDVDERYSQILIQQVIVMMSHRQHCKSRSTSYNSMLTKFFCLVCNAKMIHINLLVLYTRPYICIYIYIYIDM